MGQKMTVNSRASISAAILFCVVGAAAFLIMPLLIGAAIGPVIAGALVTTDNFFAANVLVAVSVVISFFLFIPACRGKHYDKSR